MKLSGLVRIASATGLLAAVSSWPLPGTRAAASAPARGTVISTTIPSPSLHGSRRCMIYLPPGYNAPANRTRQYPVLYLYSGGPGSQKDWFRHGQAAATADELIGAGMSQPLILVSPDGNGGALNDSQFLDSADGRQPVERFLTQDVLSYVDGHFRTIRSARGRGIAGYSAGAYGALNVGLHHPDLFSVLVGIDGYYTADPREVTKPRINHPMSTNPAFLHFNSPTVSVTMVPAASRPFIFLLVTTVDGPYMRDTVKFDRQLSQLGVGHVTRLYAANTIAEQKLWPHSWDFAKIAFRDNLSAIAAHL